MMDLDVMLQTVLNDKRATFKEHQKEAIEILLDGKRLLVVEKTGWGKSMVYFLTTKVMRARGSGPTLIISPLLALIRNQISSAEKIGLRAVSINSTNVDEWQRINEEIAQDKYDVLFISPEKLANEYFRSNTLGLIEKGIGLLVIDEAHCISDWGHDFRPDYRRIKDILRMLSIGTPVLATTATANKRVVQDVCSQIGEGIEVLRGSLARESLILRNITLANEEEKLAYLAMIIGEFSGSGIIYCSTRGKCQRVVKWLEKRGISARFYFGGNAGITEEDKEEIERLLINNDVKAVVSTNALGMGFDKPDVRYIIHYDKPGSLIEYYQQVGRAGRDGQDAYGILMGCDLDDEIQKNFISNMVGSKIMFEYIINKIDDAEDGVTESELVGGENISLGVVKSILKILLVEGAIFTETRNNKVKYIRTANPWAYDEQRITSIKQNKFDEFDKLNQYIGTSECLMNFIQKELDDISVTECGKCANCKNQVNQIQLNEALLKEADLFLNSRCLPIKVKRKWASKKNIQKEYLVKEGLAMCVYKEGKLGHQVYNERYTNNNFSDELIAKAVDFIKARPETFASIKWVTCVPSRRHPEIVPRLAKGIAEGLGLSFVEAIDKVKDTKEQKFMNNSFFRESNLRDSFNIVTKDNEDFKEDVLLVDDIVNSGWTFTICGYSLKEAGSGDVIPFALAGVENGGL